MPQNMSLIQKSGIVLLLIDAFSVLGYAIQHTLSCLLLSFVLAYLFDPFVLMLEKKSIRRIYNCPDCPQGGSSTFFRDFCRTGFNHSIRRGDPGNSPSAFFCLRRIPERIISSPDLRSFFGDIFSRGLCHNKTSDLHGIDGSEPACNDNHDHDPWRIARFFDNPPCTTNCRGD